MRRVLFLVRLIFASSMAVLFLAACADARPVDNQHENTPQILTEIGDVFDPDKYDWPHSVSDLKPDPRLVFGRLDNGLRYIILPEPDQQGRVAMRLQINVGAKDETPHARQNEQYGIAHFVEHMAFRGFKNSKTQELIKPLQRLGLSFGAGLNAFTSYDATIYQFDFPDNSASNINGGLMLFNDISRGLLMSADAFETERSVVIAENEVRNTPQTRANQSRRSFQFPDIARFATAIGGTQASIEALTIEDLRQFYAQHYRPDNALIVIAGDVQVASIKRKIKKQFGDWRAGKVDKQIQEVPSVETKSVPSQQTEKQVETDFITYREPNLPSQLNAFSVLPNSRIADSLQYQETRFLRNIGLKILKRRMRPEIARDKILTWANIAYSSKEQKDFASVSIGAGKYPKALAYFDTERRRVLEHGFLPSELEQVLQNTRRRLSDSVLADTTYNAPVHAYRLVASFNSGMVMQSPQQKLDQFDVFAKTASLTDYQQAFSQMWSHYKPKIWLQSTSNLSNKEKKFFAALKKSRAVELEPYVEAPPIEFILPDVISASAGTIRNRDGAKPLAVERLTFENGVRLNYKQTDFKSNQISVKINLGIGFAELAETDPDLTVLVRSLGLADHNTYSKEQLSRFFEGKTTNFTIAVLDDRLMLYNNKLASEDLQPFFEFMTSFLLDVDYRSKYYAGQASLKSSSLLRRVNSQPLMKNLTAMHNVLYGGDARFPRPSRLSTKKKIKTLLQNTLEPYFNSGPIEIGVSGDFDADQLLASVSTTLAAMPKRAESFTPYISQADDLIFTATKTTELSYYGKDEQAAFHYCWPITRPYSVPEFERLSLIRAILMLKISEAAREKLGKVYAPNISLRFSGLYKNYGFICAGAQVNPADLIEVENAVKAVSEAMADGDISKDEFIRAKKPHLALLTKDAKNNAFISAKLARAQSQPEKISLFFDQLPRVKKIKRADLIEISGTLFAPENRVLIRTIKSGSRGALEFAHMSQSAKAGDVKAQENLARAYLIGVGTKKDPKNAVKWYKKAAQGNSAEAHYNLAEIYGRGEITEKDRAREITHLKTAAGLENKKAQYRLAGLYENGFEEFPDVSNEEIMELYRKSAQQAYVPAQREWARHLAQGSMVERNNQEAMVWLLIVKKTSKTSIIAKQLHRIKSELSEEEQNQAQIQADKWLKQRLVNGVEASAK